MDTQQRKKEVHRFIVLVPHRDSLRPLEEYRARLFAAGFCGAFSFPMAAPLASVSRPFNREELKELGRNIRLLTAENGGKVFCTGNAFTQFAKQDNKPPRIFDSKDTQERQENLIFLGPRLGLSIEESIFISSAKNKVIIIFSPSVLCASFLAPKEMPPSEEAPTISFRAAALANLAIHPLESGAAGYSFEWRIGPMVWLPKA